jgi:heptosyltransferase III
VGRQIFPDPATPGGRPGFAFGYAVASKLARNALMKYSIQWANMCARSNIVDQIREKIARAAQQGQRGVILQPGAIGDCILTLPLAEFMKETVCRGGVDVIGHTEYIGILPGRSCVDAVRSMDSMELHRLFAGQREFEIADGDPLIFAFAGYAWIATFLGEPNGDFEHNLIFTAHCSHSAEVMTLAMKPGAGYDRHISDFYREQFIEQSGLLPVEHKTAVGMPLMRPTLADMNKGKEILAEHAPAASLLRNKTAGATLKQIRPPTTTFEGRQAHRKPVIIHPGSGGKEKCWHLDNFVSIAETLTREGIEVVFLLGPAEMERFDSQAKAKIGTAAKLLTNLSLTDVLAVLSNAGGYAGNDSGITHLSAALGVRTIAVFGPTDPAVYGPVGPAVTILQSGEPDFAGAISEELQEKAVVVLMQ